MQKKQEVPDNHQLYMSNSEPVLIPRLSPGDHISFARAWAPELEQVTVTKEEFIRFIDNLNIINAPHAAVHVVDLTSFAIALVLNEVACGVSGVLGVAVALSAAAVTYNGNRKCLKPMNEHCFHPRKLHVKIIDRKRIVKMFGLDKDDHLMVPLADGTLDLSVQDRNLEYLSQWACELSFDVPEPSAHTAMLARMAAWQVKRKTDEADDSARKRRKRAWKKHSEGKTLKEGWGK
ncbi:hypothetical protein F4775DRAFT_588340 [Biscogniauxia sp. FL1348]|nr:hypothetical protein F4775DRAFT_588340 [Biscogniauxia sp. FL1348]